MFCGWVTSTLCRVLPPYKISYSFVMISNFFLEAVSISWVMVWVGCTSCLSGLSSCIALFGHLYCNQTLQMLASVDSVLVQESHPEVVSQRIYQGLTLVSSRRLTENLPAKGALHGCEAGPILTLETPMGPSV